MTKESSDDAKFVRTIRKKIRAEAQTDAGMAKYLDRIFGVGNYAYDPDGDVWIARNRQYQGPGRSFFVIRRGGAWHTTVVADGQLS